MHYDFHAIHVDAARGNVCRHKDRLHAARESSQRPLALRLTQTTVQGPGTDACRYQLARQPVGGPLGANEQERAPRVRGNGDGDVDLCLRCNPDEAMLHRGDVFVLSYDLVMNRVVLVSLHQPIDVSIEGGREEKRLVLVFDPAKNAFDLGHEAHVGHLVGFIEDNDADLVERQRSAVEQVIEPARRRDDDIDTGAKDIGLAIQRGTTVDRSDAHAAGNGDRGQCPCDLASEFTGRDEHDGLRTAGAAL
jgi:hypothetical protein